MARSANIVWLISLLGLFLGCATYNNFRAYYNTYYNAQKSFRTGLTKVHDQPVQLNPDQFIAVYSSYPLAGDPYFTEAIDNAVQILQRFPKSKWVDNALLLIGKSYFYQQKYYQALQRLDAVLTLPQNGLKYEVVLWKTRILSEMGLHSRGVQFLQEQLQAKHEKWNISQKALITTCLAAHLAMVGKVEGALNRLQKSILHLDETALMGRSYFLLGQLYLQLEKYRKAFQAFAHVEQYSPKYNLSYYAQLKSAQAAFKAGQFTLAKIVYNQMLKDDKNQQRYAQIIYGLAKTVEQKEEFKTAKKLYKQALRRSRNPRLSAKIYHSLAQLLGGYFKNYSMAAAYYDSATTISLNKKVNATTDSRTYGRYITLKAEIARIDSLLWLAGLSAAALDSVMALVSQKKSKKSRIQTKSDNNRVNTIGNRYGNGGEEIEKSYTTAFGFLNYQNKILVSRGIRQFKKIWGERSLTDNWRQAGVAGPGTTVNKNDEPVQKPSAVAGKTANGFILYREIPFTPAQKKAKRQKKRLLQYQLANLFFLRFGKPDSAAFYYKKVIKKSDDQELLAKTFYSLYQVYRVETRWSKANHYKNMLLTKYPHSMYAGRFKKRDVNEEGSKEKLRQKVYQIVNDTLLTNLKQATRLEELALQHRTSELAADIYYQSVKHYIKAAQVQRRVASDSLKMNRKHEIKYNGPLWQKVRDMLNTFQKLFSGAKQNKQIKVWQRMIN